MRALPKTDIYAITDSTLSLGRPVEEVVGALLGAGVKIIQYREKKKKAGEMLRECEILRTMTRDAGAFFIVNDHIDIAMLVKADGVHVGQEDLPVGRVRELVGDDCCIGFSTHSPEQVAEAVRVGADYIGVGPLYATQTKEDVCNPVGLEYLDYVAASQAIPFVVIGGIKRHNIAEVVRHGGRCCCLVSELVGAPEIAARVAEVRAIMKGQGA
ncbi:Thiamine-phosphate synthase [uncultured delta proteobacterium]|uniref:Thiamine-phosphate synthase n=1 Tax=uncultured delta proteobacterium TaxID=34034 RepID=A0A212J699_9DELT|nr:Thiamine-phosphate synthase [uncultured delta proteobacterium]